MAILRPFRAWRYNPAVVGDLTNVVAPPYDVIDEPHRDALYERSGFNVVRLILGREPDRYAAAATCLSEWTAQKALLQDETPSLYLYSQEFELDGVRRERAGIIGAVRLEPFSSGVIRPHEKTLAGPKADRLRLMDATRTNLSPIFGLYAGTSATLDAARARAAEVPALEDVTDEFGVRHRVWAIADGDAVAHIAAELESRTVYIADGHHRYETALAYRDKLAAGGELAADHPANFIMMFLCSMVDPGLVILPTHRVLSDLRGFNATRFLNGLREAFHIETFPTTDEGAAALLAAMHADSGPGFLGLAIRGTGSLTLAVLTDPALMQREAPEVAPAVQRLDVTVLDAIVLRKLLGVEAHAAADDGRLRYVKDAAEAIGEVRRGRADVACLLNATRIEEVEAVCNSGETMPEKSTYFHPKLGTGFVFHSLRSSES